MHYQQPSPSEQAHRTPRPPLHKLLAGAALMALIAPVTFATGASATPTEIDLSKRPRLVVLTDIGGDPDDRESMIRLLLYSNEINLEGLIATTSWGRKVPMPDAINEVINDYGLVRANLIQHSASYPTAESLHHVVAAGTGAQSLAGISHTLSKGARLLIHAVDKKDSRPVWVTIWGGGNTLAEALKYVRHTRSPANLEKFVKKLRVYAISDQDDAGPWLRAKFPSLYYIATPGGVYDFYRSTWTGISGDRFFDQGPGPDTSLVSDNWLAANIQSVGPLGANYPSPPINMEGDTPSFLNLINNGLAGDVSPNWGGWGGRYIYRTPPGETRSFWTNGASSRDTVTGGDGLLHTSDQATIWRWRQGYQNDFAARMKWTISSFDKANHAPYVVVNGITGTDYVTVETKSGEGVRLSAANTSDPDGDRLSYEWFAYQEAGADNSSVSATKRSVDISNPNGVETVITPGGDPGTLHIILKVVDDGSPALTSYRRVVVNIKSKGPSSHDTTVSSIKKAPG